MPINIGRLDKRVDLANPGAPGTGISDGKGGYTETFTALSPSPVWASIQPADARTMERFFANTVAAVATHLVRLRYHSGVTTKTRLTYGSRYLYVRGIQNVNERNEEQLLACEEIVS